MEGSGSIRTGGSAGYDRYRYRRCEPQDRRRCRRRYPLLPPLAGRTARRAPQALCRTCCRGESELADCFRSKFSRGSSGLSTRSYRRDLLRHRCSVPHPAGPDLAAANWLVSADYLQERRMQSSSMSGAPPISSPSTALRASMTDTKRLQRKCLVYTGMLRDVATTGGGLLTGR